MFLALACSGERVVRESYMGGDSGLVWVDWIDDSGDGDGRDFPDVRCQSGLVC